MFRNKNCWNSSDFSYRLAESGIPSISGLSYQSAVSSELSCIEGQDQFGARQADDAISDRSFLFEDWRARQLQVR